MPFRFGVGSAGDLFLHFAFDHAGEWLLTETHGGYLYATRTDGSRTEVLPRGAIAGQVVGNVDCVLGVAGGFVVTTRQPAVAALHYDFATRTCKAHVFRTASPVTARPDRRAPWHYLRWAHTLVLEQEGEPHCLHLSTGSREMLTDARALCSGARPSVKSIVCRSSLPVSPRQPHVKTSARPVAPCLMIRLPLQDHSPGGAGAWPALGFVPDEGTLAPVSLIPDWEAFTPLADGQPVLREAELLDAVCQRRTLAALFRKSPGNVTHLRLFRGPEGTPLAEFHQPSSWRGFTLSSDGRLLGRQVRSSQVEVRDVTAGGPPLCVPPRGHFHHDAVVELGDRWLVVQIDQVLHVVSWDEGRLMFHLARGEPKRLSAVMVKKVGGIRATPTRVPPWLQDQAGRFRAAAWGNLIAAVDRFSQVALFEHDGTLVCMFFAFRQQIAAWMPDGTCCGPADLLGRPATPGAAEAIGRALLTAWERSTRRAQP
jgi:hypothetical protein